MAYVSGNYIERAPTRRIKSHFPVGDPHGVKCSSSRRVDDAYEHSLNEMLSPSEGRRILRGPGEDEETWDRKLVHFHSESRARERNKNEYSRRKKSHTDHRSVRKSMGARDRIEEERFRLLRACLRSSKALLEGSSSASDEREDFEFDGNKRVARCYRERASPEAHFQQTSISSKSCDEASVVSYEDADRYAVAAYNPHLRASRRSQPKIYSVEEAAACHIPSHSHYTSAVSPKQKKKSRSSRQKKVVKGGVYNREMERFISQEESLDSSTTPLDSVDSLGNRLAHYQQALDSRQAIATERTWELESYPSYRANTPRSHSIQTPTKPLSKGKRPSPSRKKKKNVTSTSSIATPQDKWVDSPGSEGLVESPFGAKWSPVYSAMQSMSAVATSASSQASPGKDGEASAVPLPDKPRTGKLCGSKNIKPLFSAGSRKSSSDSRRTIENSPRCPSAPVGIVETLPGSRAGSCRSPPSAGSTRTEPSHLLITPAPLVCLAGNPPIEAPLLVSKGTNTSLTFLPPPAEAEWSLRVARLEHEWILNEELRDREGIQALESQEAASMHLELAVRQQQLLMERERSLSMHRQKAKEDEMSTFADGLMRDIAILETKLQAAVEERRSLETAKVSLEDRLESVVAQLAIAQEKCERIEAAEDLHKAEINRLNEEKDEIQRATRLGIQQIEEECTISVQNYQNLLNESSGRMERLERIARKYKSLKEKESEREVAMESMRRKNEETIEMLMGRCEKAEEAERVLRANSEKIQASHSIAQHELEKEKATLQSLRTRLEEAEKKVIQGERLLSDATTAAAERETALESTLTAQRHQLAEERHIAEETIATLKRQLKEKEAKLCALAASSEEPLRRVRGLLEDERRRRLQAEDKLHALRRKAKEAEEKATMELKREQLWSRRTAAIHAGGGSGAVSPVEWSVSSLSRSPRNTQVNAKQKNVSPSHPTTSPRAKNLQNSPTVEAVVQEQPKERSQTRPFPQVRLGSPAPAPLSPTRSPTRVVSNMESISSPRVVEIIQETGKAEEERPTERFSSNHAENEVSSPPKPAALTPLCVGAEMETAEKTAMEGGAAEARSARRVALLSVSPKTVALRLTPAGSRGSPGAHEAATPDRMNEAEEDKGSVECALSPVPVLKVGKELDGEESYTGEHVSSQEDEEDEDAPSGSSTTPPLLSMRWDNTGAASQSLDEMDLTTAQLLQYITESRETFLTQCGNLVKKTSGRVQLGLRGKAMTENV